MSRRVKRWVVRRAQRQVSGVGGQVSNVGSWVGRMGGGLMSKQEGR